MPRTILIKAVQHHPIELSDLVNGRDGLARELSERMRILKLIDGRFNTLIKVKSVHLWMLSRSFHLQDNDAITPMHQTFKALGRPTARQRQTQDINLFKLCVRTTLNRLNLLVRQQQQ